MSNDLVIRSQSGPYTVHFDERQRFDERQVLEGEPHFVVDANVARLHGDVLSRILAHPRTIVVEATESQKEILQLIPIYEKLVALSIRRDHVLTAIGGGVVQDICCFIASTILRGIQWRFVPTTLLAQADSCIGSKSSINLTKTKNILGTFHPPRHVIVNAGFLDTLDPKEMRSGIGEILKVHAIEGVTSFDGLASNLDKLIDNHTVRQHYVNAALAIKKRYIETDEFDKGVRNVFNYGHSFGHAIESASQYAVPHGIAVSIGMDMANHVAAEQGLLPKHHRDRMHTVLRRNYEMSRRIPIAENALFEALLKDKKNIGNELGLILAVGENAEVVRVRVAPDRSFQEQCSRFLVDLAK